MPISGLVLTLDKAESITQVMEIVEKEPCLTCGELQGNCLPVVLETEDDKKSRDIHDWLMGQASEVHVEVVYVGFEDPQPLNTLE